MAFDIKQHVDGWRAQLLDTSRRNRLINFKVGRGGGVWLVYPDPGDLWHRLVVRGNQLTFAWKNELLGLPPETEETNQARAQPSTESDLLQRCRTSPRLRPTHLLTDLPDKQLAARLSRLALAAREAAFEQGTVTLYVAFGFLRWFESPDSEEEIRSPLLLVPVWLERENVSAPWQLRIEEEEVLPNHTLVQCLKTNFCLSLPTPDEAADTDDATWRTSYFAAVQRLIRNEPRWKVLDETALGTFNFQKLAMWEDLGRHADRIAAHDLCRAIAGDRSIAPRIPSDLPRADELDRKTRPEDTYHILDADSSQHEAIVAVTRGANLVLDGPPGTGKSQTIANIIAEFLAAGKTVLFVSEKVAALEVVKKRLDQRGLGDFCLDLHSHKANKGKVRRELDRCLKLAPESVRDFGEELRQLEEVRSQLNDYVHQLHQVRQPLGRSVFQVHGELARFSRLTSKSRCSIPQVLERDARYLDRVTSVLAELPHCRGVVETRGRHPWKGCRKEVYSLALREDVAYHFPRLAQALAQFVEVAALLHQFGLAPEQPNWTDCRTALENARQLLRSTSWWEPAWRQDLANLITSWQQCYLTYMKMQKELAPRLADEAFAAPNAEVVVQANRYRSFWTRLLPRWWFLKAKIKRWYKGSPPAVAQLLEDLQKLAIYHDSYDSFRRIVRERGGEWLRDAQGKVDWKKTQECLRLFEQLERVGHAGPRSSLRARLEEAVRRANAAQAAGCDESWRFLTELFNPAELVSTGLIIDRTPLTQLADWLRKRAADVHQLQEWIRFYDIQRGLQDASVPAFLNDVLAGSVKLEEAADAFRARFFQLWLDAVYTRVPVLQQFQSERHERLRERFRELDRRSVQLASARIRQRLLSRPDRPRAMVLHMPESSELGILLREVNKSRRHLPLRKLFTAVSTLLPRLKPCLMMSPLAVSTYLPPDLQFDLVIFDEASQVRPQDAICAIYRGRHLLVAGDQKQLPPTSFFERFLADEQSTVEETDQEGLEDFESILDVCCTLGLPRRRLRWHYRSRREALIAFSNRHFYDNELVTFPSINDLANNPAITFEYISEGRWKVGRGGGFNAVEARRVAESVLEHFRSHPEQSLGVIAFNLPQQMRILDELERLRREHSEFEKFFRENRDEPFFVKNLENVQGDERDVIFLSVGYGPDETGRVAMRFGPLNRQGGERRLNVAVTRARFAVRLASSLRAHDIDLSRTNAVGVRLLRAYLDYAERGTIALLGGITEAGTHGFDSPFEQEVFEELTRRGLTIHPQVGCSGFRIDLAIVDPHVPGRYVLGVECDGAAYHSSATARDRDRLRQEVLESLGWRFCRIWSTDWLRNREGQVRRVFEALDQACRKTPTPPTPERPISAEVNKAVTPLSSERSPVTPRPAATPHFDSIDKVPDKILRDLLLEILQMCGATPEEELVRAVRGRLGFERTGSRIQERVATQINEMLRLKRISRGADGRLQITSSQPNPGNREEQRLRGATDRRGSL